jgi:DHA1 family tetracycline resistance protein-like MFS transporter
MMANRIPADAQGELQGAAASLMSLTMIFSPLLMTGLFHRFSRDEASPYFPGAPFLAAAFLTLMALGLFLRAAREREIRSAREEPSRVSL